jgi:hypothetical protein
MDKYVNVCLLLCLQSTRVCSVSDSETLSLCDVLRELLRCVAVYYYSMPKSIAVGLQVYCMDECSGVYLRGWRLTTALWPCTHSHARRVPPGPRFLRTVEPKSTVLVLDPESHSLLFLQRSRPSLSSPDCFLYVDSSQYWRRRRVG